MRARRTIDQRIEQIRRELAECPYPETPDAIDRWEHLRYQLRKLRRQSE